VVETLERLHEMGIRLSLDDFGTGYSSLSHLVQFPIDTLKIDQSFVRELGVSRQADAITTAVVKMGHNLGLEVVAEGVETADQERFLLSLGCDTFQGYLYSRPIEADDLAELLRERASAARTADGREPS
jgi:EAL domain-containing protein (putative c-di-GMP-specific phosphodiesterase class I)